MEKSILLRALKNNKETLNGYSIQDASTEMWE